MAIIQFDNGTKVKFEGNPTPEDVEEVSIKLGLETPPIQTKPSVFTRLGQGIGDIFTQGAQNIIGEVGQSAQDIAKTKSPLGKITRLGETGLRTAGTVAGTAGELITRPVQAGVRALGGGLANIPAFQKFATGGIGEKIAGGVESVTNKYNVWAQKHPEAAKDFESVINIGVLLAGEKPLEGALQATKTGVKAAAIKVGEEIAIKQGQRELNEAIELTKPVLTKQETITTFEKAGRPGGITQKGKFGKITRVPTEDDIEIAKTAQPFINKSQGVTRNLVNLNNEITRFSQNEIRPFLKENPRAFNVKTFEAHLKSIEPPDWIKADVTAEKTYELVRNRMIDAAKKNKKTTEGLWDSRKFFDEKIEEQFGDAVFDPNRRAYINKAIRDMRHGTNNFIADSIGDKTFTGQMKRLNRIYDARGNIAEQKFSLLDKNIVQRFIKENPGKAKLLRNILIYGVGGGTGLIALKNLLD